MSHHKIEVRNLYFSYPNGHEAVKNVSFTIYHGESVGLIGANGAGKSTLLMLLVGLLFPVKGEVLVGDVMLTGRTLPVIRQRMGFVFQNPDDQLFMPTVYDDVAFGPRNLGLDEDQVKVMVERALETVGILHLRDRAPFRLSGGEKRTAAIASVLSMQPDILIMDEPTSALDPGARRRVINLLKSFDHTRIIASHDLDMVLEICRRVIVLKEGEIAADGMAGEILCDKKLLESCELEMPLSLQSCPVCGAFKGLLKREDGMDTDI